ncbi:uncharacterized protein [Rutidosis leptorrhynchoides]|uniref:uncharacterized protein n=1 Tax=Rutidosis leptorrhynchoides TaxID=125765 RepID=UPI003A999A11
MNVNGIRSWLTRHVTWKTVFVMFMGQLVSLVLALASFSSSLIATLGVDAPITQMTFTYMSLAIVYGGILLLRSQKLLVPWYWYLLLGFVDVEGNFLVNKAYQFSSLTSVTLLDCWTIPWAIVLTYIFIGSRYSLWQYFGAVVCIGGLALVLVSDAGVGGGGGSKPVIGDVLVIAGTVFFAMSNVGEEFCCKKKDRVEVVTMIGVFGFIVSAVQLSILELKTLEEVAWSKDIVLALVGYTVSSFLFYTLTPFVLKLGGAAMFNLSLLTSDMWAVVFRIFLYKQQVDWLYYIAFAVVVIGLVIYTTMGKDPVTKKKKEKEEQEEEKEEKEEEEKIEFSEGKKNIYGTVPNGQNMHPNRINKIERAGGDW